MIAAEDTLRGLKTRLDAIGTEKAEQDAVDYEMGQREARADADASAETAGGLLDSAATLAATGATDATNAKTAKTDAVATQ